MFLEMIARYNKSKDNSNNFLFISLVPEGLVSLLIGTKGKQVSNII